MLTRLRWSAFGLRGRIVGAVVVTAFVTLIVAALVLLPQLEHSLKNASKTTLQNEIKTAQGSPDFVELKHLAYYDIVPVPTGAASTPETKKSRKVSAKLTQIQNDLLQKLGATSVTLLGYFDQYGNGHPIVPNNETYATAKAAGPFDDARQAYLRGHLHMDLGEASGGQVVRAAVPLPNHTVLVVRASIQEIPGAVAAVRRAFGIAAIAGLVMTLLIAIPLAATLVRRLHRLREAALQLAIGGSRPVKIDRARDEVGDLSRAFDIMSTRLHQQEQARRQFVATASHELRTPLASLEGMLELLAEDLSADPVDLEDAGALLERARVQSRRLGRLAADLLDLSRIDAEVTLRSEPVELAEMSRAVLAEFELAASERGVNLVLTLSNAGGQAWATGDPGSIARILRILIDNALRVAPPATSISVTVFSEPTPTVTVSDEGPGVPVEERTVIFERFKRGRDTRGQAGFGLGLAIGRELALRMRGTLTLVDREGPGATFALALPEALAPEPDSLSSSAGI